MSQLVKTKRQANFKDFKRFGALKGLVEQKKNVVFNSFVCQLGFFGTRGSLNRSFHSRFKLAHSCQKNPNLYKNSSNKLVLFGQHNSTGGGNLIETNEYDTFFTAGADSLILNVN
jgi:hypothetical protein